MGSISSALTAATDALGVLQRSVNVVQNNIINASTPNYAQQDQVVLARSFNPGSDATAGGIASGPLVSSRNPLLEATVWRRQSSASYSSTLQASLTRLQQAVPIAKDAGVPAALDRFYASASQLAVTPNAETARQDLLYRAQDVTDAFRATAGEIAAQNLDAGSQVSGSVRRINELATEIASINEERRGSFQSANNSGLDARLHSALEELSTLVPHTTLQQPDGSTIVSLNGQTPLVIGQNTYPLSIDNVGNQYRILDAQGQPITSQFTSGKLGAQLTFRNQTLPDFSARLDALAQGFADGVNTLLAGGVDQNGNPPAQNLFSYTPGAGLANSLSVNPLTPAEIAAAAPGDPGGNGNAVALGALGAAPLVAGQTTSQYYGQIATLLGSQTNSAKNDTTVRQQLLEQAQLLRQDASGVSVDREAAKLLELQRGYQAIGQVINILNQISETLVNLIH